MMWSVDGGWEEGRLIHYAERSVEPALACSAFGGIPSVFARSR